MSHYRNLAHPRPDRHAKRETAIDYSGLALPKTPRVPDAGFRAYVRGLGCQVKHFAPQKHSRCANTAGTDYTPRPIIDFCHVPTGGTGKAMGRKASDMGGGIGMCHALAVEQETTGWKTFAKRYGIDAQAIARDNAERYAQRSGRNAR